MYAPFILGWIMVFQNYQLSDCGRVEVVDALVQGNLSDSQTLRFKFFLDSNDNQQSMLLKCGYYTTNDFQTVVQKSGITGPLTPALDRFDPYIDPGNINIVGFTIKGIRKEDARDYFCTLGFLSSSGAIQESKSPPLKFEVLIRPEWVNDNCLRDFDSVLQEGGDLNIDCLVTGIPTPLLQCTLHKFNGELVDGDNRMGPEIANFTRRPFGRVSKESRRIMCQAYAPNSVTGTLTKVVDMPSQFKYSPFAVRYCEVYSRTDRAIQLRWLPILSNETSPELLHYAIEYYIEDIGSANLTRKTVSVFAPNNPSRDNVYIYYTLDNLVSGRKYVVSIFGVNSFREGQSYRLPGTVLVSKSATKSSSVDAVLVGGIVGGVVGGIVLILVVVFLFIYCSKQKESKVHFPTSYVEDAVDYPNQGGLNMYAQVNKGKTVQKRDSTSDYPDVVVDGKKKRSLDNGVSPSYEMSNKAYV